MNRCILILILGFMLCGCGGTKVITVDVPRVEKEYVYKTDTLIKEDSIYIFNDRYVKNDTIYITKFQDRYKYLYKNRIDTLVKVDTVTIVNTEQIEALSKENDALRNVNYFYRRIGTLFLVIIGCLVLLVALKRK